MGFIKRKAPFRYYNWWKDTIGFNDLIDNKWHNPVRGSPMYQLVMKLKRVKKARKFGIMRQTQDWK